MNRLIAVLRVANHRAGKPRLCMGVNLGGG
jgi:hypothetical protein